MRIARLSSHPSIYRAIGGQFRSVISQIGVVDLFYGNVQSQSKRAIARAFSWIHQSVRQQNYRLTDNGPRWLSETDEDRSYFLTRLPIHERASLDTPKLQVTPQVGTKLGLSRDQVEILDNCRESAAMVDLLAAAGRTNRTKFRDQVLNPLLEAGLIERTFPDKPRSSKQRYRITEAGRMWLSQHGGAQ